MYTTLISTEELSLHLQDPDWVVIDCRFALADPAQGERDYLAGHIPGSLYAHLDHDLSAPIVPGKTGRHPLPSVETAAQTFSHWGIDAQVQVIAYDGAGGALAAVRLWWLLRWLGHSAAAVLDGGWQKWLREGRPVRAGLEQRPQRVFIPHLCSELLASAEEVDNLRLDPAWRIFDSRNADRYRGENEIIDPVGGHIPGAYSAPYAENLAADGVFLSPETLRQRFQALLAHVPGEQAVFYCGSGVTAIHNILALQVAGLGEARLYAGSWSEWITDARRPVAR